MNKETFVIIGAVLASPFLGILATSFFNKRKTGAETHNLNISGEISIGDAWRKYGEKQEADALAQKLENTEIRKQMSELHAEFLVVTEELKELRKHREAMYAQAKVLADENKSYKERVETLEEEVKLLRAEVEKYRSQASPEHLAEVAHGIIETVKDQTIINNAQE